MAILSNFQSSAQEAIKIAPPTQSGTLTYNGSTQSPSWTEYPASVITVTSTPQTNAGTYNAVATLTSGHVWADTLKGGQRNIPWTIGKASGGVITLSKNAVELEEGGSDTVTVTLTGSGDNISAVSSNTAVASVSVSENTITISDGGTEGSATITVNADGNYVYTNATITVTVQYVKIVTWSDGTDQEIIDMVAANDAGQIDLYDYWAIGDERNIHLLQSYNQDTKVSGSAEQDATIFLMCTGGKKLSNGYYCKFIVGFKDCIGYFTYPNMNSTYSSGGGWESCRRRTWFNEKFYAQSIPSTFRPLIKQHKNLSSRGYSGGEIIETDDYIAIPSYVEVFGLVPGDPQYYGVDYGEGQPFPYYATQANRIRKINKGNTTSAAWWTRSPYTTKSTSDSWGKYWNLVKTTGEPYNNGETNANHSYNPFFCIGEANIGGTKITSWSDSTVEQLEWLIQEHYEGKINIGDYWNYGDVRTIHLSAMSATYVGESHREQDVQVQIIGLDHDNLVNSINGHTKAAVTLELKNMLRDASVSDTDGLNNTENGYMNSTETNVGGWTNCNRRSWCNEVFYNALPSWIKSMIKTVVKTTSAGNASTSLVTTNDKIFLTSGTEVLGDDAYQKGWADNEGTTYKAYLTNANLYKKLPYYNSTATYGLYWSRSPYVKYNNKTNFVAHINSGQSANASSYCGIAPAFCI